MTAISIPLRKFLVQLTQFWFRLTLEFDYLSNYMCDWKEVQEKLPIPRIEHVKLT
ncbi:unnamed protein product, partial [Linum tenue]